MEILEKVQEANSILNEIETYYDSIPSKQSKVDSELSDLLHYIENNNLNASQSCKIVKQMKKKRIERRGLLNDFEMLKTYRTNSSKLSNSANREFLLAELNKTAKKLNCEYKNRIYNDEQLKELKFEE